MKSLQVSGILLLLLHVGLSMFYPPLFWHKDNCVFRSLERNNGTKEFYLQVVPNNGMNVVCPNQVTINNWLSDAGISSPTLMENMWLVDKQGYDTCTVNQDWNKPLLLCDNPRKIKSKLFVFHPRFNSEEPKFAPGQHYYFISTSRGFQSDLSTRKVSGSEGSCEKYHMKLHIYVCNPKKEDCVWQMKQCSPLPELYRDMKLIDGKLPAPTSRVLKTIVTKPTTQDTAARTELLRTQGHRTSAVGPKHAPLCTKKEKSSTQLVLNFVLGGIAIFMAIVIVIIVFGLTNKSKNYELPMNARISTASSSHDPKNYLTMEVIQLPDGKTQLSPVMMSRTPPTSPDHIVEPQRRLHHPLPNTPPESPQSHTEHNFVFPERRHSFSGTSSTRNSDPVAV